MQVAPRHGRFGGMRPLLPHAAAWLAILSLLSACPDTTAATAEFLPEKLAAIDEAVTAAIAERRCPGGVVWIGHGAGAYHRALGCRAMEPEREPMTKDTIFDLASLTKVLATTPAVMRLVEESSVALDAPASRYIGEFRGGGKEAITVRQLLTHTSGLRAGLPPEPAWSGSAAAISLACAEPLPNPPGTVFRYSDINFILLGEIVRRVSGEPLDGFVEKRIFAPLGMTNTRFAPPGNERSRIAPTLRNGDAALRGIVHDPTARRMGGVAGSAGLFSTAGDVARFARMMLRGGELDGVRVFDPATVKLMTAVNSPAGIAARRGLGWDIDSPYSKPRGAHFAVGGYGHTGWTGSSIASTNPPAAT
jgi:CubicO group peptidase (beta-lactamase class C family)